MHGLFNPRNFDVRKALAQRHPRFFAHGHTTTDQVLSPPLWIVLITAAASATLAYVLFFSQSRYLCCDAANYLDLSKMIRREGIFGFSDPVRSYGYPLFVALSGGWAKDPETVHFIVFNVQLVIFFITCWFAAHQIGNIFGSRTYGIVALLIMALNPILLIRTTEFLTESLSAALVLIAVVLSWPTESASSDKAVTKRCIVASSAAGLSVAVRPGNLVVLLAILGVWLIRSRIIRDVSGRAFVFLPIFALIPLLPQVVNNYREYGTVQPTVVSGLYTLQLKLGVANLKYGTVVSNDEVRPLYYSNPFLAGVSELSPSRDAVEAVRSNPSGYIMTLATHGFALFDQDFPFTYIEDLTPWYRWPLSLANYFFMWLAIVGIGLMSWQLRHRILAPGHAVAYLSILLAAGLYMATYLPVRVENRFSTPIYLLATPCVLFTMGCVRELFSRRRLRYLMVGTSGALIFVVACVALSTWLQQQAPLLG